MSSLREPNITTLYGSNINTEQVKAIIVIKANGRLLLVSLSSSEVLTLINIKIKRNSIDTAPTYTNK